MVAIDLEKSISKHQMELDRNGVVTISRRKYDSIMMKSIGVTKTGRTIQVSATYAFSPGLSFYNVTDGWWIDKWEWEGLRSCSLPVTHFSGTQQG